MDKVYITKIDEVYLRVDADDKGFLMLVYNSFTFDVPGAKYMPQYRLGRWDGKIKLYNLANKRLYVGLLPELLKLAESEGLEVEMVDVDPTAEIEPELVSKMISDLKITAKDGDSFIDITPYDDQIKAVQEIFAHKRSIIQSATSSGKSLILYLTCYILLQELLGEEEKILLVFPTTTLVEQIGKDFAEYSRKEKIKISDEVHKIYSGREKDPGDLRIVATTWQSVYDMDADWFKQFSAVLVDEAHTAASKSITQILTNCKFCRYRVGLTGTLSESKTALVVLRGLLGQVCKIISAAELMEKKRASELHLDCFILTYSDEIKKALKKVQYHDEITFLEKFPKRNKFIVDLARMLKGNTLVLFKHIEHGQLLFEALSKYSDRKVYFVDGGVEVTDRTKYIAEMEVSQNSIILATYQTFQQGINIKNLHNIVFGSPSKSKVRNLQSIGRGMRKSRTKDKFRVIDIADDLCWKSHKNHTYRHFLYRLSLYQEEGFEHRIHKGKI